MKNSVIFWVLVFPIFLTACGENSQKSGIEFDKKYVVNKVSTSCECRVQQTGERPQFGQKHLGPFDTREEANKAMCADIDPDMSNQNKCWITYPSDVCKKK